MQNTTSTAFNQQAGKLFDAVEDKHKQLVYEFQTEYNKIHQTAPIQLLPTSSESTQKKINYTSFLIRLIFIIKTI